MSDEHVKKTTAPITDVLDFGAGIGTTDSTFKMPSMFNHHSILEEETLQRDFDRPKGPHAQLVDDGTDPYASNPSDRPNVIGAPPMFKNAPDGMASSNPDESTPLNVLDVGRSELGKNAPDGMASELPDEQMRVNTIATPSFMLPGVDKAHSSIAGDDNKDATPSLRADLIVPGAEQIVKELPDPWHEETPGEDHPWNEETPGDYEDRVLPRTIDLPGMLEIEHRYKMQDLITDPSLDTPEERAEREKMALSGPDPLIHHFGTHETILRDHNTIATPSMMVPTVDKDVGAGPAPLGSAALSAAGQLLPHQGLPGGSKILPDDERRLKLPAVMRVKKQDAPTKHTLPWNGMTIAVEHTAGDVRHPEGPFPTVIPDDMAYGFFEGVLAVDGDSLDAILGPGVIQGRNVGDEAHIAVQLDPQTGAFRQYKVMIGFGSAEQAKRAYLSLWPSSMFGGVFPVSPADFTQKALLILKVQKRAEPCAFCKEAASMRVKYAEGKAYIPACKEHRAKADEEIAKMGDEPASHARIEKAERWDAVRTIPILKVNEEKQLVTGIALEPDEVDAQEDTLHADVIERTAHRFLAGYNRETRMGVQHRMFGDVGVELVESWLAREDCIIGKERVKKGSWLVTIHVTSRELWGKIKRGEITGFSIGGIATVI